MLAASGGCSLRSTHRQAGLLVSPPSIGLVFSGPFAASVFSARPWNQVFDLSTIKRWGHADQAIILP